MKRELVLSFAGHALVIGLAVVLTSTHVLRDERRPAVLTVQVVSAGTPLPQTEGKGATVVEPKPKAKSQSKTQSKPAPKSSSGSVRRQGLGARIEGADALGYSYYLNAILAKIGDNWLDPYLGEARKITGTVVFVIERDGTVRDVKVEKTSGDPDYDAAAERALLVLDKLPPLPPEFTGPRLKLHLEFEHTP
jgi:TonB family protein